jgi:hypothetical protein
VEETRTVYRILIKKSLGKWPVVRTVQRKDYINMGVGGTQEDGTGLGESGAERTHWCQCKCW